MLLASSSLCDTSCPVHGSFSLHDVPACTDIICTPEFQRLRQLKQLGLTYFQFESAEHSRYPHSLGVAHLARTFTSSLQSRQPELDINDRDIACVTIAGLCHDLGHGPFSHTFEKDLLPRLNIGKSEWYHEDMSCRILDLIMDQIPDTPDSTPSEDEVRRIKQMIDSKRRPQGYAAQPKGFLFDIVANKATSIDVDKFDYLGRDSLMCRQAVSFDLTKVMRGFKVIGTSLCWHKGQYMALHDMFQSREALHRQVYTHHQVKAVNLMLGDALYEAQEALGIRDMVHDPALFLQLDDTILQRIQYPGPLLRSLGEGQDKGLRTAQSIIQAVHRRQLYVYINEVKVPQEDVKQGRWKLPSAEDILSYHSQADKAVSVSDVIVTGNEIDYSMDCDNPMDRVGFYETWRDMESFTMTKKDVSLMLPDVFEEHSVRVYCRNRDQEVCHALELAFGKWKQERFGERCILQQRTPVKERSEVQMSPGPGASRRGGAGSQAQTPVSSSVALLGGGSFEASAARLGVRREECLTPTSNKKHKPL